MISLTDVNAMERSAFIACFGEVAEHAPWVAERAETRRPFASAEDMVAAFQAVTREAPEADRLRLIRAHPDLAGRAAIAGELAEASRKEQAAAGLDLLTPDEFARFSELNSLYRARFGIPFIFAVKGASKHQILDSFAARLDNDRTTEHANALDQVCRIVAFRIAERLGPQTATEPPMRLSDFSVLTFDCYGTLIDWETGMAEALAPLASKASRSFSRDEILNAHARHESSQQRTTPGLPYARLLAVVYKRLGEEWGVPVAWEECLAYGRSVRDWPAFGDSTAALQYLKQHYRLVVLSNVDNESFAHSNARLNVAFDAVYTAEDIGSYKPEARNFAYMLDKLATLCVGPAQVLHTAESLFHDHQPANGFGLASCWIHRRHAQQGFGATMDPGAMPRIDFRFTGMAEMAEAHRAETGG